MNLSLRGALLAFAALAAAACGGGDEKKPPDTSHDPTFTNVTSQVLTAGNCAGPTCHSSASLTGFVLGSKSTLYGELVGAPAAGPKCGTSGLTRVVAGQPDQSLLYLKISQTNPPCGDQMPQATAPLTADKVDLVRQWILAGALND